MRRDITCGCGKSIRAPSIQNLFLPVPAQSAPSLMCLTYFVSFVPHSFFSLFNKHFLYLYQSNYVYSVSLTSAGNNLHCDKICSFIFLFLYLHNFFYIFPPGPAESAPFLMCLTYFVSFLHHSFSSFYLVGLVVSCAPFLGDASRFFQVVS